MSLSNKQRAFAREIVKDWNATQASIRAGYSEHSASAIGWENLRKPEILAEIDRYIMSAEQAAKIISDIADGDLADLAEITPNSFTFKLMTRNEAGELVVNPKTKLIKKIKQEVTTILSKREDGDDREIVKTELELYSAHDAAKDILKYRGKLVDKSEVKTLTVDYTELTNDQLLRIAKGEDVAAVLSDNTAD